MRVEEGEAASPPGVDSGQWRGGLFTGLGGQWTAVEGREAREQGGTRRGSLVGSRPSPSAN